MAWLIQWPNNVIEIPDSCHLSTLKPSVRYVLRTAIPWVTGWLTQFQASHLNTPTSRHNNRKQQTKERLSPVDPLGRVKTSFSEAPCRLSPHVSLIRIRVLPHYKPNSSKKNRIIRIGSDQSRFTSTSHKRRVDPKIKALPTRKREQ